MSTVTVHLPTPLAERLQHEAQRRSVTPDTIVQEALEQTMSPGESPKPGIFARLSALTVSDPECPTDLATNAAHMEGFGVPRSA